MRNIDKLLLFLLAVCALLSYLSESNFIVYTLRFALVIFIPGYVLVDSCSRKLSLPPIEKAVASVSIGVSLSILLSILLGYLRLLYLNIYLLVSLLITALFFLVAMLPPKKESKNRKANSISLSEILIISVFCLLCVMLPLEDILKTKYFFLYDPFIAKPYVSDVLSNSFNPSEVAYGYRGGAAINGFYYFLAVVHLSTSVPMDEVVRFGGPALFVYTFVAFYCLLKYLFKSTSVTAISSIFFVTTPYMVGIHMMTIRENLVLPLGITFLLLFAKAKNALIYSEDRPFSQGNFFQTAILLILVLSSIIVSHALVTYIIIFILFVSFCYSLYRAKKDAAHRRLLCLSSFILLFSALISMPYVIYYLEDFAQNIIGLNIASTRTLIAGIYVRETMRWIPINYLSVVTLLLFPLGFVYLANKRKKIFSYDLLPYLACGLFVGIYMLASFPPIFLPQYRIIPYLILFISPLIASFLYDLFGKVLHVRRKSLMSLIFVLGTASVLIIPSVTDAVYSRKWIAWSEEHVNAAIDFGKFYDMAPRPILAGPHDPTLLMYAGVMDSSTSSKFMNYSTKFFCSETTDEANSTLASIYGEETTSELYLVISDWSYETEIPEKYPIANTYLRTKMIKYPLQSIGLLVWIVFQDHFAERNAIDICDIGDANLASNWQIFAGYKEGPITVDREDFQEENASILACWKASVNGWYRLHYSIPSETDLSNYVFLRVWLKLNKSSDVDLLYVALKDANGDVGYWDVSDEIRSGWLRIVVPLGTFSGGSASLSTIIRIRFEVKTAIEQPLCIRVNNLLIGKFAW